MSNMSKILFSALLVIVIALAFGGGYYFGQVHAPPVATGTSIINEAWNDLFANYVDPTKLDSANMTRAAIQGIVSTLHDRYTTYLSKQQLSEFMSSLQGQYAGIGSVVSMQDEKPVIVHIFSGSPAEKNGLKAGDTILEINGESTVGMTLDIATSKIRGSENTSVKLLILHQGETVPIAIELIRATIDVPSVLLELRGNIACVSLLSFTEHTEDELTAVIKQLKAANAKGIVLDLRGNPGGYLDTVIKVASNFITEGVIVKVRSNQGIIETHKAASGLETTDLPMVVLVDENSASGAEVLAGSLQDHNRALIAGNTTYGKGSVTLPVQLSDGSGLYITIARWLTPNDRLIEGQGITPDIKLDLTGDAELQWAIDYLTGKLQQ
ncbi:MAG: S41 family peptidase [Dehalococcoidales bacterium]